jgi:tetratricopeptide (TPR) repeat protein
LVEAGEAARATDLLEKVVRLRPYFLPAREQLGLGLVRRSDLQGAAAQAEALIAKSPQAAEGHRLMALVLWKQRDYDASLAECAMALASDPDSPQMLALQAVELWQLDRKKEANAIFVRAAKARRQVATADELCRLLVCDARDIGSVDDFLRKNRWAVTSSPVP